MRVTFFSFLNFWKIGYYYEAILHFSFPLPYCSMFNFLFMPKQFLNVDWKLILNRSPKIIKFWWIWEILLNFNFVWMTKIIIIKKLIFFRKAPSSYHHIHFLVTITMVGNSSWNFNFFYCQMPQNTCWFDSISLKKSIKKAFHEYFIVKLIYTIFPFLLTLLCFPTYSFTVIFFIVVLYTFCYC